ncbi:hypothetical protein L345_15085, partial [Ophiophagus hannah]
MIWENKQKGLLAVHGDGKHGKDVPNEEGAREDGERGNMGCGNVAGTNAGHELHAVSVAHDGTGADAGCAGADDSDGDGDKEADSAYGSTESDGCALVPGSALQLDPGGAWQEDVECAAAMQQLLVTTPGSYSVTNHVCQGAGETAGQNVVTVAVKKKNSQ